MSITPVMLKVIRNNIKQYFSLGEAYTIKVKK